LPILTQSVFKFAPVTANAVVAVVAFVAKFAVAALKLATTVVDVTTNGAVHVATLDVN